MLVTTNRRQAQKTISGTSMIAVIELCCTANTYVVHVIILQLVTDGDYWWHCSQKLDNFLI